MTDEYLADTPAPDETAPAPTKTRKKAKGGTEACKTRGAHRWLWIKDKDGTRAAGNHNQRCADCGAERYSTSL